MPPLSFFSYLTKLYFLDTDSKGTKCPKQNRPQKDIFMLIFLAKNGILEQAKRMKTKNNKKQGGKQC